MRIQLTIQTLLALAILAVPAFPREEYPVILRLTTGAEVSGVIPESGFDDATGITLRRDDNGGILRLRWDQIRDADVTAIKAHFGFGGDETPPIKIAALEVKTTTGTLIGIDAGREEGKLLLRRKSTVTPIPIERIVRVRNVMVDALELEHPAAVFEHKMQTEKPTRPVDWYNLGQIAESLILYDQARTCFSTVLELDPDFSRKAVIERKLADLDMREKEHEQTMAIRSIRALKYRGAFREALAQVEEFEQTWPDSMQIGDVQKEKASIGRAQRKSMLGSIRTDFFSFLRRVAEDKSRDRELILGDAMTWAKEQAYLDVQEKLMTLYGITEQQVDDLWANRGSTGSPRTYSYGGGTFILGDEAARKGYEKQKEKDKGDEEEAESPDQPQSLQDKIAQRIKDKQAQRNQAKQKNKKKIGRIADVPPTQEDWWNTALPKERSSFLIAFFAEQAEKVTVISLRARDCSTCYGKGILEFYAPANPDSDTEEVACPRCKTLTFDRIVVFR